jgi:4-carboxymuconolactone decarboxylase
MATDRLENGRQKLREVVGETGEQLVHDLQDICPDLGRYVTEYAFADIYSRPGLNLRTRELAAVAALTVLGHPRPQLKLHINGALNVGCTRSEVIEVVLQMTIYGGFPVALNGMSAAREVFQERDSRGQS